MTTHLVIPDSHAKPDTSLERYKWAGHFAIDRQPDVIVNMGDWYDMPSLCSYDRGRRSFEGRRYNRDLEAGREALGLFEATILDFNNKAATNHKTRYRPVKKSLEGNHEHRADRVADLSPELHGTVGTQQIAEQFNAAGWEWVPYEGATPGVVVVDGVAYSHYFISGVKGLPISGESPAAMLIKKKLMTCVVGHQHIRDFAERTTADGRKMLGLVSGCYLEDFEAYAGVANYMWWSGLILLKDVADGYFDPEFVSFETLRRMYGG